MTAPTAPAREQNKIISYNITAIEPSSFRFFPFSFPPPQVLCAMAGCRGVKTFFLSRFPSENSENAAFGEQLAVRKAFLKQLPGNIVLTNIPDVILSFSMLFCQDTQLQKQQGTDL